MAKNPSNPKEAHEKFLVHVFSQIDDIIEKLIVENCDHTGESSFETEEIIRLFIKKLAPMPFKLDNAVVKSFRMEWVHAIQEIYEQFEWDVKYSTGYIDLNGQHSGKLTFKPKLNAKTE